MVKDFKRWTTQLAATVLYNGRGAANLLGADMTWKMFVCPELIAAIAAMRKPDVPGD